MSRQPLLTGLCVLGLWTTAFAQPKGYLYDETRVPDYSLPELLTTSSGQTVDTVRKWEKIRRPELLRLFTREVYGKAPGTPKFFRVVQVQESDQAFGGQAIRKQVVIAYGPSSGRVGQFEILMYLPRSAKQQAVPVFLGLNFRGNHSIQSDPEINIPTSWMRRGGPEVVNHLANAKGRGIASSRWPVEKIVSRGYGLATIYYGDIDPDFDDGFQNGVHGIFGKRDQERPGPTEWGSIAGWAWGLSRALDYLEQDPHVDGDRVAVFGHSRLGKTSLWAGANDPRFAMVISNNSGCGGAALSRRQFGETVKRINTSFPHWFCDRFPTYNDSVDKLPVDQHQLIALMAPRPVYVASASRDLWADPKGEFLSAKHAEPIYRLYGKEGLPAEVQPSPGEWSHGTIGYHLRDGKHDVTDFDWDRYLDFADRHLRKE